MAKKKTTTSKKSTAKTAKPEVKKEDINVKEEQPVQQEKQQPTEDATPPEGKSGPASIKQIEQLSEKHKGSRVEYQYSVDMVNWFDVQESVHKWVKARVVYHDGTASGWSALGYISKK